VIVADLTIEITGWMGALLVLLAYFLLTTRRLDRGSRTYHVMNLAGGIALAVNSVVNSAYPSGAVNVVWIAIATYGILRGIART